jgi:hypothetical protein
MAVAAPPLPVPASVVTSSSPWKVLVMMLTRLGLPPARWEQEGTASKEQQGEQGTQFEWAVDCQTARGLVDGEGGGDDADTLGLAACR